MMRLKYNTTQTENQAYDHHGGPPRGFGEQGNKGIYFREIREQMSKNEGKRGTKAILGNGEHKKSRF